MSLGISTLTMGDRLSISIALHFLPTKPSNFVHKVLEPTLSIVKIWNGLTRFQTPWYDQQQDQLAGGRQCGRLHNIGSYLLITALMSSRTSCQKSDKIRQKSAPMSLGSSCQKSDKDQPPCPLGLVVKNQTLKVKAVYMAVSTKGHSFEISTTRYLFGLKIHRNLPHF